MCLGSEIRKKPIPDPEIRKKPIPDPGSMVKKAPNPGSGSTTLLTACLWAPPVGPEAAPPPHS
jgi:hypothetical protein